MHFGAGNHAISGGLDYGEEVDEVCQILIRFIRMVNPVGTLSTAG